MFVEGGTTLRRTPARVSHYTTPPPEDEAERTTLRGIIRSGLGRAAERIEPWRVPASVFLLFLAARLTSAYTWFWGARTKHPWLDPPFGWLEGWFHVQIEHNPLPGYAWMVENVILPNIAVFGWVSFVLEVWLALALAVGFATRLNGWVAALWAVGLGLGNLGAPREPVWSLLAPIAIALVAAETRAGRRFGLDARLRTRWMSSQNRVLSFIARWGM